MLTLSQIDSLIAKNKALVLDGGLATALEMQGHDLNHDLWSAKLLVTDPDAIRLAHRSYLAAGSMCITTASYQASFDGLAAAGISESNATKLLMDSVLIARRVVDESLDQPEQANSIDRPLVAASIGPYGAYLADGSEYRGNYGISRSRLRDFHARRLDTICQAQPDLLACETIPSAEEASVLRNLLEELTQAIAWVSFSCVDGEHICDGTPLQECAALLANCPQVFAVGVNCSAPQYIGSLIDNIRAGAPSKRIVVYPNSGQSYDVERRTWTGQSSAEDFGELAKDWVDGGATLVGGCCQTGPDHIRAIREAICGH